PSPVNQVATVEVIGAREFVITPFDTKAIEAIESAMRTVLEARDLEHITPTTDGETVSMSVPPMTEERRSELARMVAERAGQALTAVLSVRRDAMDKITADENGKRITEDERQHGDRSVENLADRYVAEVRSLAKAKEKEIMEP